MRLSPNKLLAALVILNLIVGGFIASDFGRTMDETNEFKRVAAALSAYSRDSFGVYDDTGLPRNAQYYGTAMTMIAQLADNFFRPIFNADYGVIVHYFYFVFFQIGIVSLYFLTRKFISDWASLGTAALLSTQPLFFGHAFINPKDIILMSVFTATFTSGVYMVDAFTARTKHVEKQRIPETGDNDRHYSLMGLLKDKTLLLLAQNWQLLFAGFVWGWTIATRVVGIFAGCMVGLYFVLKAGKKSLMPLIAYSLTALGVAYLAFPALWKYGLSMLVDGLVLFSDYDWGGELLYQGRIIQESGLPPSSLPFFFSVQFTEPLIILFMVGLGFGIWRLKKKSINWQMLLIVLAWLVLPVVYVFVKQPRLYSNCRQFFFIVPPMFVLAGIGLQGILEKLKNNAVPILLCILILFPGVLGIVQLHPYQYIYYNEFVGGVDGAFREYQLDYWRSSIPEALRYLNEVAPENARIILWDGLSGVEYYARQDLVILKPKNVGSDLSGIDYVVLLSRLNSDLLNLTEYETIYTIERNGAILAVIKQINASP